MNSYILSLYYKKRIFFNAILSICQVLVGGGTYFFLYTMLLRHLGSEKLGTWSVVLSTTAIANVANIGISSSIVKYISGYSLGQDDGVINSLIKTSFISISCFMGVVTFVLFVLSYICMPIVLPTSAIEEGRSLLPLSFLSLWLGSLASIFLSSLDGLHFSSLRSIIYIVTSIFFLLMGYFLMSLFGLMGVAIAQFIQALFLCVLSFFGVKIVFRSFSIFPLLWDKEVFKAIYKYSVEFQIIGICQLLYDPITKFLLSRYGGLSFVGYYEMSSRLVVQIRALIVSANQILVPSIVSKSVNNQDVMYAKTFTIVMLLTLPLFTAISIFCPYISYYWIGKIEPQFILSLSMVTLGWLINIMSTPAYFSCVGLGDLKWILISHVVIGVVNPCLGFLLGHYFAGAGVVLGWIIALSLGSLISFVKYNRKHHISYKENTLYRPIFVVSLMSVVIILAEYTFYFLQDNVTILNTKVYISFIIFILYIILISRYYIDIFKQYFTFI